MACLTNFVACRCWARSGSSICPLVSSCSAAVWWGSPTPSVGGWTVPARTAQLAMDKQGLPRDGPLGRSVAELRELTQGALAEMRALIFELRPEALAEEGIVAALRKQAAALSARSGLPIAVDGPRDRLD